MKFSRVISVILFGGIGVVVLFYLANQILSSDSFSSFNKDSTDSQQEVNATSTETSTTTVDTTASTSRSISIQALIGASQKPGVSIQAIVADTEALRAHGLSDRISLGTTEGMLFIFPSAGLYGFWMKDMHFPLDMIWIREDKQVIAVDSDVLPDSFPKVFVPPSPIVYVLEVNAGFAEKNDIKVGTFLKF